MKRIILFFLMSLSISIYGSEINASKTNEDLYNNEKVTLKTEKYYDQLYPGDAKYFTFYQGEKIISLEQFISISQDDILLKNQKILKDVKIGGFTGAAILGGLTLSFFIPSMVFVALQLNYYREQVNYKNLGYNSWLEYYNAKYPEYFIPGLTCIVLTTASIFALLIDLSVTISLIYKYKFNERLYQEAVERYNDKLKQKYGISPELGFISNGINFGIKINL